MGPALERREFVGAGHNSDRSDDSRCVDRVYSMRWDRILILVGVITLMLIMLSLGWVYYALVIDRAPPIVVKNMQLIHTSRQFLGVVEEWEGLRECRGVSQRWVVDGARIRLPDLTLGTLEVGERREPFYIEIPPFIEGHNSLEIRWMLQCNPLHWLWPIEVRWPLIPFVVPPPPPMPPVEVPQIVDD